MKKTFNLLIISLLALSSFAQSVTINPTNGSALIDTKSTTQGFQMPQMSYEQIITIPNPAEGLQAYLFNSGEDRFLYYQNGWQTMYYANVNALFWAYSDAATHDTIYNLNTGKVGIGTPTPTDKLTVKTNSYAYGMVHTDGLVEMGTYINDVSGQFGTKSNHRLSFITNNGSEDLTLSTNGKVGVNNINPQADLHIKQTSDVFSEDSGGLRVERQNTSDHWALLSTSSGVNVISFNFNGFSKSYIRGSDGVYVTLSDSRLKKDIQPIGEVLPSLLKLEAKTYHYKDNEKDALLSYGFIAQDVEKLFPDFVNTKTSDGIKGIAYQNFGVTLIKAIQERQRIIEALTKRIEQLENKK